MLLDHRNIYLAVLFLIASAGHLILWHVAREGRYRLVKVSAWAVMAFVYAAVEAKDSWEWFAVNQRLFVSAAQTFLVLAEINLLFHLVDIAQRTREAWKHSKRS